MHPSLPQRRMPRPGRWRLALLSGLAFVAATGSALLVLPQHGVHAQQPSQGAPPSFADLVDRVRPAVVSIQVVNASRLARQQGPGDRQLPGPGDRDRGGVPGLPFPDDSPLREFFKRGIPQRPLQSQGAGFVISADGYVVTNNHVVADAKKVQVAFDRDNKYEADVVGTDDKTDLALLKIKAEGKTFSYVPFAKTMPRVGEWVVAVGNPFGLGGTVTAGIVSAHGREIAPGPYDFMQIDAAVNKGNSGGPSFNLQGEVVGVNTAIYSPTGVSVGIAFAIPAPTASEVIAQLKEHGSVKRGWLGVKIQSVDDVTAASLGLREAKGALVNEVMARGPADEAGVKSGDTILAVNGTKIADSRDLARKVASLAPDTKVDLKILRAQKEETVQVKLGLMPTSQELSGKQPPFSRPTQPTELQQLGLIVAPPTGPNRDGLVVTEVDPNSDAAQKIRVGDAILEINFNPVSGPDDLVNAVREANRLQRRAVLLRIRSGSETRFVAVQLRRD